MNDGEFEWSDQKAVENFVNHGITFETAREAFKDPFAIELVDDREDHGEDRYGLVAMVEDRLLYVAYTLRGDCIRIISARGAEPRERRQYHEEND